MARNNYTVRLISSVAATVHREASRYGFSATAYVNTIMIEYFRKHGILLVPVEEPTRGLRLTDKAILEGKAADVMSGHGPTGVIAPQQEEHALMSQGRLFQKPAPAAAPAPAPVLTKADITEEAKDEPPSASTFATKEEVPF